MLYIKAYHYMTKLMILLLWENKIFYQKLIKFLVKVFKRFKNLKSRFNYKNKLIINPFNFIKNQGVEHLEMYFLLI